MVCFLIRHWQTIHCLLRPISDKSTIFFVVDGGCWWVANFFFRANLTLNPDDFPLNLHWQAIRCLLNALAYQSAISFVVDCGCWRVPQHQIFFGVFCCSNENMWHMWIYVNTRFCCRVFFFFLFQLSSWVAGNVVALMNTTRSGVPRDNLLTIMLVPELQDPSWCPAV